MKTFCFLIAAVGSLLGTLYAQEAAKISFNSTEVVNNGQASLTLTLVAYEDINVLETPEWQLPSGMQAIMPTLPGFVVAGDTILLNATLTYPTTNLPYYPQEILVALPLFTFEQTLKNAKAIDPNPLPTTNVEASGHLYFTPYNTLEIWSIDEFMQMGKVM